MTNDQIEIAAATLVLLRETPAGVELFMAERAKSMGFAGGMMVFPGGKVDPADVALAEDAVLAPGFAALDPVDAAARIAAIRETFEEAGVLVTTGGGPVSEELRDHWRARMVEHEESFADFLKSTGRRLDVEALVPFAHWCPPLGLEKKRFDTRFYLARMPADETALHDGNESTRSHWITAKDALARADAGENAIIFPTRRNLERLALSDSIDSMIASARATPVVLVQPIVEQRNGVPHLCIPDNAGYPVTAQPLDQAMRG